MYVCICNAVTDRAIEEAVQDGARTMRDLRRDLGVASQCGRCARTAKCCLTEARAQCDQGMEPVADGAGPALPLPEPA